MEDSSGFSVTGNGLEESQTNGSLPMTGNNVGEHQTNGIASTKDETQKKEFENVAPVKLRTRKDRVRVRLRSSSPLQMVLQNGCGTPPMSPTSKLPPRPKSLPPAPPPKSRFSKIAGADVFIFPPEDRQRRLSNASEYSDISDVSDTSTIISPLSGRLIPCRPRIKPPPPPPPRPNLTVQSIPIGQWRRRSSFHNLEGDKNPKDLDELTDEGVKRRHLHLVASKKTFEKRIAQKLAEEIAAKDQLTSVLNDVKTHKAEPRVKNTAQEVKNIIESKIEKSEDGDRVYSVKIKMGEFSSNISHTLMQREVLIQGSMENNDKLTKEINVEFPEKINMEKFELSEDNGIIRILVPFYSRQEWVEMEKERRGLQPITEDDGEFPESRSSQDIDKFMEKIRNSYKRENNDSISLESIRKENMEKQGNSVPLEETKVSDQPADGSSKEFPLLMNKNDNSNSENVSVLQPLQLSKCLNISQRAALRHLVNFSTKDKIADSFNKKRSRNSRYKNVEYFKGRNGADSNGSNPDSDRDSLGVETDSSNSDSVFSDKTSNINSENVTETASMVEMDSKSSPIGGSTDLNLSGLESTTVSDIGLFHGKNEDGVNMTSTQDTENADIKCSHGGNTDCTMKLSESQKNLSNDSLLENNGKNNNINEKSGCQEDISDSNEGLTKSLQSSPLDDTVSSTLTVDSAFVSIGSGGSESD